jgi:hypothetical protein
MPGNGGVGSYGYTTNEGTVVKEIFFIVVKIVFFFDGSVGIGYYNQQGR